MLQYCEFLCIVLCRLPGFVLHTEQVEPSVLPFLRLWFTAVRVHKPNNVPCHCAITCYCLHRGIILIKLHDISL